MSITFLTFPIIMKCSSGRDSRRINDVAAEPPQSFAKFANLNGRDSAPPQRAIPMPHIHFSHQQGISEYVGRCTLASPIMKGLDSP